MAREMKDSGVEWIGLIPDTWKLIRGKYLFTERNERGNKKELQLLSPTQRYGVVPQEVYEELSGMKAVKLEDSIDLASLKSIYVGDYCISLRSFQGGFEYSKYNGVVSPAYHVFHKTKLLDDGYYRYLFKDRSFIDKMASLTKTFRDGKSIAFVDFSRSFIPFPPVEEQRRIASFLDHKCEEINGVIDETEKTIEEYKALKQSIITEAVTKGVRGKRTMKDSGIEWIGEIPEEWECKKAKYSITISNGSDPKTEGDIPVYGSGANSFRTCGEYKEGPTVLIGRKGATLHIPHFIEGKYWNVDTAFDVKTPSGFVLKFYYYLATSFDYKYYISQTTLPGMTQTNYENMFLPVPTHEEQDEIVDYLDTKCAELDQLILAKEQLLAELESYKKSVIYEYVTGKKEVPACQ